MHNIMGYQNDNSGGDLVSDQVTVDEFVQACMAQVTHLMIITILCNIIIILCNIITVKSCMAQVRSEIIRLSL